MKHQRKNPRMKTSHIIAISATSASAIIIASTYVPQTTRYIVATSLLTILISLCITLIKEYTSDYF